MLALAGFCAASTCATEPEIPNMTCIDYTTPNGTQAAIHIHNSLTASRSHQEQGRPGKQLQMAQFYSGDPGQPAITECGQTVYQNGDAYAPTAATGADCYAVWAWVKDNVGFWTLTPDNLRADPWTCALLMTTVDNQKPSWAIYVGNEDVAVILSTVISAYMEQNGKLQVTGVFNCPTSDGKGGEDRIPTSWWIRNSQGIIT
ncbi:hypothetical protein PG993_002348 [Apiospora rasikravindrae]|uniref:Ecp2 effector protein-like domain-containing protein n=1 Tax=Apiospora rasikravindrae TaxID=990691 RepID=A0ABR1TWN7_9PEZI